VTIDLTSIVAFLIGSLAVGRLARLVVDDDFPPVVWLRGWWIRSVPESWGELVACAFCVAFWFALADVFWAFISELHWTWWFFNATFASAYLGAIINKRDLPAA
jgi:hypothetical protein